MFNAESKHLLNLSVQNALDCISEDFNVKHFPGRACTRISLEKCALRNPDGRYRAHIVTIYYISRPPLSQNPSSAPSFSQICTIRFMYLIQFDFQMSLCRLQHGCFLRQILYLFPGSTQLRLKLRCPVLQAPAHFALKLKSCWGFGSSVTGIGELCA